MSIITSNKEDMFQVTSVCLFLGGGATRPHLIQCTTVMDMLIFQYSRLGINILSIELAPKAIVLHSTLQS